MRKALVLYGWIKVKWKIIGGKTQHLPEFRFLTIIQGTVACNFQKLQSKSETSSSELPSYPTKRKLTTIEIQVLVKKFLLLHHFLLTEIA